MWIEDLTPLDLLEVTSEQWYKIACKEYEDLQFDFDKMCRNNQASLTIQRCVRPKNHLGPHVCGGNRFSYTALQIWT